MIYSSYTDMQLEHSVEYLTLELWIGGSIDEEEKKNVKGHAQDLSTSVGGASHEPRN